jgi:thiamine kinase-like enzyme
MTGEDQIARLPCWHGSIEIRPLPGGITNRNYRVTDQRRDFVARLGADLSHLGVFRHNERLCQQQAALAGIAPEVVYHQKSVLVSQFVEGRTLEEADLAQRDVLQRLVETLRCLHGSRHRLTGELLYFCPFQTARTYAATARELGAEPPSDIADLLEDAAHLAHQIAPFRPTLCHNDLLAANLIDNGERLWLVDWEYAGMGHPLFDLAGVSANCGLSPEEEAALLGDYQGATHPASLLELRILKTVSLLRESLWAVIQTKASDLEFDYGQYAAENFAAYRSARAALEP